MFWATLLALSCTGEGPRRADSALPELPPPASEVLRPEGEQRPVRALRVALTGEVRGEIEPCGCPTLPYGGFVRRARYLEELEAEPGGPLFRIDAGEALLKGLGTSSRTDVAPRAALILSMMKDLGVGLMVPGPSDLLALGLSGLKDAPIPMISASWRDAEGQPVLPTHAVLERGGLRLGVVGLSGAPAADSGLSAVDPVLAAREALAALPEDLDLVLAVSNLPGNEAWRVAQEVEGFAAVLSTMGDSLEAPRALAGATLIEAPDRGRYVTVLRARLGSTPAHALDPQVPEALAQRRQLLQQMARLEAQGSAAPAEMKARLAALEAEVEAAGRGRNLVEVDDRPLGRELDGEATLAADIERFKQSRLASAQRVVRETEPAGPQYVTSGDCVRCHSEQLARWSFTGHARATATLIRQGKQGDVECIACHSTGFGEEGGFAELDPVTLRTYGGVQCEACHGPLGGHPGEVSPRPVNEETCLRCHDAANSPNFNYAEYLPAVICPSMPPAQLPVP
ncbi:MAG: hypothetical protein H6741_16770 [Alphaproteobacteria bacterium]|nr:hypothetical protein [Alphaproteobacteria bacterium]MCB9794369.1 hypothetical protein [Alphaproteobacteria bacterium]